MNQVKNFFQQVGAKFGESLRMIKDKTRWQSAEDRQKEKIKKWLPWAIAGAAIIIIVVAAAVRFLPRADQNAPAPLATAKVTIVTARACGKTCWDTQLFVDALKSQNIKIAGARKVYVGGWFSWWPLSQGSRIVKQFQIAKVPTVIIEFTGDDKPDINNFFSPALGDAVDGKFVLTKILAPYYDLIEKKIKGVINVTYLTDQSCAECYDIKNHELALKNLGAYTANSKTIDVSEPAGQELVKKYNITKVPTLLISGEVSEYTILTQAWAEVGIIADDGTYIFTNLDLMGGSYKNLATGKIILAKPPVNTAAPAATVK